MDVPTKLVQDIDSLERSVAKFSEQYSKDNSILNDEIQEKLKSISFTLLLFEKKWTRNYSSDSSTFVVKGLVDTEMNKMELGTAIKDTMDLLPPEISGSEEFYPEIKNSILKKLKLLRNFTELAIIYHIDYNYHCLICRIFANENSLLSHCKGRNHTTNMADPASMKSLTAFNNIWNLDKSIDKLNKYMTYPESATEIECQACDIIVDVNNIRNHFSSKIHINSYHFKSLLKRWKSWKNHNRVKGKITSDGVLNELRQDPLNQTKQIEMQKSTSCSSIVQSCTNSGICTSYLNDIAQVDLIDVQQKPNNKTVLKDPTSNSSSVQSITSSQVTANKIEDSSDMLDILKLRYPEFIIKQMSNSRMEELSKDNNENKAALPNAVEILKTRYPKSVIKQMSPSHKEHAAKEIQKEMYELRLEPFQSNNNSIAVNKVEAGEASNPVSNVSSLVQTDLGTRNEILTKSSLAILSGIQNDNCLICRISVSKGIKNTKNSHWSGTRHKNELKNKDKMLLLEPFLKFCDSVLKSDKDPFFLMNKYLIYPETQNSIYCKACDRIIRTDNVHNFLEHLGAQSHIKSDAYLVLKSFYRKRELCKQNITSFKIIDQKVDSNQISMSSHLNKSRENLNKDKVAENSSSVGNISSFVQTDHGTISDMQYSDDIIQEMNKLHPKNSLTILPGLQYDNCLICRISVTKCIKNIIVHLNGTNHKNELKNRAKMLLLEPFLKFCDSALINDIDPFLPMNKYLIYPEHHNSIYCKACDRSIRTDNTHDFLVHLKTNVHIKSDAYFILKYFYYLTSVKNVNQKNDLSQISMSPTLNNIGETAEKTSMVSYKKGTDDQNIIVTLKNKPKEIIARHIISHTADTIKANAKEAVHPGNECSSSLTINNQTGKLCDIILVQIAQDECITSNKRKLNESFVNLDPSTNSSGSCITTPTIMELLSELEKSKSNTSTVNNSLSNSIENILQISNITGIDVCENTIETVLEVPENEKTNKKFKLLHSEEVDALIADIPNAALTDIQEIALWLDIKDCDIHNRLFLIRGCSTYICDLCEEKIKENAAAIHEHIESDKHKTNIKDVVISHRFYCHPCNFTIYDELWYEMHKNSSWHKKRLIAFCEMKQDEVLFEEHCCRQCGVITFGESVLLPEHQHATYKKQAENDKVDAEILCLGCNKKINFSREYDVIHISTRKMNIGERFTEKLEELLESGDIQFEFAGIKDFTHRGALMTEMHFSDANIADDQYAIFHIGIEVLLENYTSQYSKLRKAKLERNKSMKAMKIVEKKELNFFENIKAEFTQDNINLNVCDFETVNKIHDQAPKSVHDLHIKDEPFDQASNNDEKNANFVEPMDIEESLPIVKKELQMPFNSQEIQSMVNDLDENLSKIMAEKHPSEQFSIPMICDDVIMKSEDTDCLTYNNNTSESFESLDMKFIDYRRKTHRSHSTTELNSAQVVKNNSDKIVIETPYSSVQVNPTPVIKLDFDDLWVHAEPDDLINKPLFEFDGTQLECKICNMVLSGNKLSNKTVKNLMEHIHGKTHKRKISHYFSPCFLCEQCDMKKPIMGDFRQHRSSREHLANNKLKTMSERAWYPRVLISECRVCCVTTIINATCTTFKHEHFPFDLSRVDTPKKPRQVSRKHSRAVNKKNAAISRITALLESEKHLCKLSENMLRTALGIMTDNSRDLKTCISLEEALRTVYPNCKAYPFGSRISGLAISTKSDLDVFLDTGDMYDGTKAQDSTSQEHLVNQCNDILKRTGSWDYLNPITKARTPIIQAMNTLYNVDCDISFRHGLSVENTMLLKTLLSDQPIARRMILVLKSWADMARMSFLGGYILSFLVVFYLQTKRLLPPICSIMQCGSVPKKIICGWECQLNLFKHSPRTTEKIVPLLRGLFEFYAKIFDYEKHVISPILGLAIIKKNFENPETLPSELEQYKRHFREIPVGVLDDPNSRVSKWVMDHPSKDIFRHEVPVCLQDPFDLSHNLTKAMSTQQLDKFKEFCDLSAKVVGTKPCPGFNDNFID